MNYFILGISSLLAQFSTNLIKVSKLTNPCVSLSPISTIILHCVFVSWKYGNIFFKTLIKLLCNVFPAYSESNGYIYDDLMKKVCNTISLLIDLAKNDPNYQEIPSFYDALDKMIENNNDNCDVFNELKTKSQL